MRSGIDVFNSAFLKVLFSIIKTHGGLGLGVWVGGAALTPIHTPVGVVNLVGDKKLLF